MTTVRASPILQLIRQVVEDGHLQEESDSHLLQRFSGQRDEAAFGTLLRRHGPMVLEVCQDVLGREADAEDAFQATFLILARKVGSIRKAASLGSWLYGVAHRTALKARAQLNARRKHEGRAPKRAEMQSDDVSWREVRQIIHDELTRIPERFRMPLVLCYLQGNTQDVAAAHLGVAKSTLRERLERGRALLRSRLTRRGLGPPALLAIAAWPAARAPASAPMPLLASTLKAATAVAADDVAAMVSTRTVALAEGVLRAMLVKKLARALIVLVALGLLSAGVGIFARNPSTSPPDGPTTKETAKTSGSDQAKADRTSPQRDSGAAHGEGKEPGATSKQGRLEGRFTAAGSGKPVVGARVRVLAQGSGARAIAEGLSDADGRYGLSLPLGHVQLWGVYAPAGYYTQDPRTYGLVVTTATQPRVVRDFVLQPGAPWRVEVHGVTLPPDQLPLFSARPGSGRHSFAVGEIIEAKGDSRGKAVLTIPPAGGRYQFVCALMAFPSFAHGFPQLVGGSSCQPGNR